MPLITPEYAALNAELHERIPAYGTGGEKWAPWIQEHCQARGYLTVLDYGCGKGSLKAALPGIDVTEYDPAIPGKDIAPQPADLVVCTDVLEHVEEDCLDDVLAHLASLARGSLLLGVSCRESGKKMADGRGAHILVRPHSWWAARLSKLGPLVGLDGLDHEFNVVVEMGRG